MLKQREESKHYRRRNAVHYVDLITGVDWNEVRRGGEDAHERYTSETKETQVQKIRARLPRRLTLTDDALMLPEGFGLNVETPRSGGGDDDSDSSDDFGDDSSASS